MKNPSQAFCYRNERLRPVHGCSKVPTEGSARVKARDKEKTTLYCVDLKKREYSNYKKNINSNTKSLFSVPRETRTKDCCREIDSGYRQRPTAAGKKEREKCCGSETFTYPTLEYVYIERD